MAIKTMKILIISLIFCFLLSNSVFAQLEQPKTIEEAKEMGDDAIEIGKRDLPGIIENLLKERVFPIWKKMYDWFYDHIFLNVRDFFQNEVIPRITGEYEKRKPIIKEEFEQEKEELKEELPETAKTLWQRFEELWK